MSNARLLGYGLLGGFIVYGVATSTSIGMLFLSGIFPGFSFLEVFLKKDSGQARMTAIRRNRLTQSHFHPLNRLCSIFRRFRTLPTMKLTMSSIVFG